MILYQDTSSICKRYLKDETGVWETQAAMDSAEALASSLLALAEVKGVLARVRRGGRIRSNRSFVRVSEDFETDWADSFVIAISNDLMKQAGELATRHALTGVDALHLASAMALRDQIPAALHFSTWDFTLAAAAQEEGFALAHEVNR